MIASAIGDSCSATSSFGDYSWLWIACRGCGPRDTPMKEMPKLSASPPPPFHVGLGLVQASAVAKWILANDGLPALRAHRHCNALDTHQLLHPLYITAGVGRKLVVLAQVHEVLFPTRHFLVDRHGFGEQLRIRGKLGDGLPVGQLVRDGDLQLLEAGQHVELGDGEAGEAVDTRSIAEHQRVEPAA